MIPYSHFKEPRWPVGSGGAFHLASGTLSIPGGSVLDYESFQIDAGATLILDGSLNSNPVIIGSKKAMIINGSIISKTSELPGSYSVIDPARFETFTHNLVQQIGGAGGHGGSSFGGGGGVGGVGTNGMGGGGGGGAGYGGNGGAGGSNGGPGSGGGAGGGGLGNVTGGNGGNGVSGDSGPTGGAGGGSGGGGGGQDDGFGLIENGGGGGGGGRRGKHSISLELYCLGDITGIGTIDLRGQNGFNGGAGAAASGAGGGPGGAGGGGAGGSAGNLKARYHQTFSVSYNVSGGTGGTAGAGGAAGVNGTNGTDGSVDLQSLNL